MITRLSLKNFKAFKELEDLKIKPITILTGTNSCGKSSILQSLLLLKQTVESKNLNQTLLLNGRFVHLGALDNIILSKDTDNPITLDFSFDISKGRLGLTKQGSIPVNFILKELISEKSYNLSSVNFHFHYKIRLRAKDISKETVHIKPIDVEEIKLQMIVSDKSNGKIIEDGIVQLKQIQDDWFQITWKNITSRVILKNKETPMNGTGTCIVTFANLVPTTFQFQEDDPNASSIQVIFYRFQELLSALFSTITYIGPLREEPSRRYIYEDEIVEIGIKGENAAYIYLSEQDNSIAFNSYFYNEITDTFEQENHEIALHEALTRWNNLMGIREFRPEIYNDIIQLNMSSTAGSSRVNIADVGFGVSQIFPIILEGLRIAPGGTLLLEQPEIHLHPGLQMKLADYFIALALANKSVVVETHSDTHYKQNCAENLSRRIL